MAEPVKWGALLALLAVLPAHAELPDPTRPPFTQTEAAGGNTEVPLTVSALYLTSKRPYALIHGMNVFVGDPLGDGRVTRIDEQGVWLKGAAGEKLLRLLPEVVKTPVAKASPPKESAGKGRKRQRE